MSRTDTNPVDHRRLREVKVALWLAVALFLGAMLLTAFGCTTCEPIVKTEYQPYPVPLTLPCQKPAIPPQPPEPVIAAGATEDEIVVALDGAWDVMRSWALELHQLLVDMPGETAPADGQPPVR